MAGYKTISTLDPATLDAFDQIIDVRSPGEFAEDHLPGAINLPVLDDEERARVGTIYKQVSSFDARKQGAALVSANIGRHLAGALADKPGEFRPLIYCWRGGMRSNSMALVLASIGWRVSLLDGGYRRWRRAVTAGLEVEASPLPIVLIDGQTGVAKTALLHALAERGGQVIDLEGLAHHRGSVFGGLPNLPQPSQKAFETRIWDPLRRMDLSKPIYVEAESSLVGKRRVPPRLWTAMKSAPRIEIKAPTAERARYLVTAYPDMLQEAARLETAIDRLAGRHAADQIARWRDQAAARDYRALAESLVIEHYDPAYSRSRKRRPPPHSPHVLETDSLAPDGIAELADRVLDLDVQDSALGRDAESLLS